MTDAELVQLAAEKVMGLKSASVEYMACHGGNTMYAIYPDGTLCRRLSVGQTAVEWNPLTSDADCWAMVDAEMRKGDDARFTISSLSFDPFEQMWDCYLGDSHGDDVRVRAACRRRAIVRACLRAVGLEV